MIEGSSPADQLAAVEERRRHAQRSGWSRYRDLVLYMTYAELRTESERTYIGFLWWIVEPVISMFVYYLVFQVIMQRGTENFVAFLFVGLVPWRWLATSVTHGANSILSERSLMQQVYLSKLVFPIVSLLTDTLKFLVVFVLVLLFVGFSGFGIGSPYAALPFVFVVQFLIIAGLTILFAALTPFLPDLRVVLANLIRLWFFLSGIFWDVKSFSPEMQRYLRLNPMTVVIESYRDILLHGRWPALGALSLIALAASAVCLAGILCVRRWDFVYPKLQY